MSNTEIPFGKLVTVRVKGQSKRLTRVVLAPHSTDEALVRVRNGKRGRPVHLPVDRITEVKVLATV